MRTVKNPNCDGENCLSESGTVKVLPIGEDSNLFLCETCFNCEMQYRRETQQRVIADGIRKEEAKESWPIERWSDLNDYNGNSG